ncbi:hypothetical protein M407DRAFT_17457 [Tulasnella calospora MUT 4182]|uniref:RNase III domain-containing protein n=1 Tax=Tulasnella calospora MUT 4182 TaxID=1051891 RepID=A0A0C3QVY9_9AGAM|nr:hypothetical protein M407DRAFT_17457 [Tulasnella calospora MUT 4182]
MTTVQPPPPPLQKEIEDLVFTHKSLFPKLTSVVDDAEDPKDWDRVAFLGDGILLAAMSRVLYYAHPRRRTTALKPNRTQLLSKESLAAITDAYGFTERMRCLEPNRPQIATSLDTRAALTESFVGGLALQYGIGAATQWAAQMLAWKHGLPVPQSDEQRLGQVFVAGTMPASPSPPRTVASPTPTPGPGPVYPRPGRSAAPRPEHPQIRPPQEAPPPVPEYTAPYQQHVYAHQSMYQGGASYPQMTGLGAATPPTNYNPGPSYPHHPSRPLPQPGLYMQAPSSPPTAASVPQQAPQQVDYRNFGYNRQQAPPAFSESVSYQQPPPQAAVPQPQFQMAAENIRAWSPQVPGVDSIPYGAPSPSGPRAFLD